MGGFEALLEAVEGDELKVIVAFSSSTGRFGRKGQVAYAAANEVLNKLAQREAHERPGCRVLSMNWGPWEGGMVTPQLQKVFALEGVGLIRLLAGAAYLVREMSTPAGGPVEIVILGPEPVGGPGGKVESKVESTGAMVVAFEREVSISSHPILRSHVMKGRGVVPMALIVEWLAHGALHENPGMMFVGFDDLRIFKGVTMGEGESVVIRVLAGAAVSEEGAERVAVELRSGKVLHARASIVLGGALATGRSLGAVAADRPYLAEAYGDGRLFHGADLQGILAVEGWSMDGIVGQAAAAPGPGEWMEQPMRSGWVTDPLALDAAFQLMILWCFEAHGVGSLPTGAGRYRQFAGAFPKKGSRIQIHVQHVSEHAAEAVVEFLDEAGGLIARMDGYECVMDGSLKGAFAENQLAE